MTNFCSDKSDFVQPLRFSLQNTAASEKHNLVCSRVTERWAIYNLESEVDGRILFQL